MAPAGNQGRRPWRWPWSRNDGRERSSPLRGEREPQDPGREPAGRLAETPVHQPPDEADALTMRQSRPAARWDRQPATALDRQIRLLYRHLAGHWGASRDELRIVSVPVLLWLAPRVVLAGPERITVLARGRPDRRVQLYHLNRDQMVTFSAGRLEPDVSAPWTHPLRQLLFEWLSRGTMVTGVDASLVCTGPEGWHAAEAQAVACALGCLVGAWTEPAAEESGPAPFWPASVEWPPDLSPFAQAWQALATAPLPGADGAEGALPAGRLHQGGPGSEGVTPGDGGWAWVILGPPSPAVFRAGGVSCLEAVGGGQGAAAAPDTLPLWALPPTVKEAGAARGPGGVDDGARMQEALGCLAAALESASASQIRGAAAALARLTDPASGQTPAGWLVLEERAEPGPAGASGLRRPGAPQPVVCRRPRQRRR